MNEINKIFCNKKSTLIEVLEIFEKANSFQLPSGICLVVNEFGEIDGIITDGDLRRALLSGISINEPVGKVMQKDPIVFSEKLSISEILEKIPGELVKRKRRSNRFLGKIILIDENRKPTRILNYHELWEQKVAIHRHLVVVGLGYVGLTMAVVMADAGFQVTGVDVDSDKIDQLNNGSSYIHEIGLEELLKKQINKNLHVTTEIPNDGDVYIISVGTPVISDKFGHKRPIMDFLVDACNKIGKNLERGNLVVLRSTVPVGTCRNFVKKQLEVVSGLSCGIDFHLSFAPERTAEGKALKELRSLPQIIGGFNRDSVEATAAIFRDLTPIIVKVDSLEAAEMAKLINNSFRDYVFAFSNQMAKVASSFNIDIVDVIKAANEGYPRDPVPLPSPGVGGPCLTKDPHIFATVAENSNLSNDIFLNGRKINESMHDLVFDSVAKELIKIDKQIDTVKILVCGLAFKGNPETGDIRNSSGVEIATLFLRKNKNVFGYDPVALHSEIKEYGITPVTLEEGFRNADVILFLNNHKSFEKFNLNELIKITNINPIIYDGWHIFRADDIISIKPSVYMGLSFSKNSILR